VRIKVAILFAAFVMFALTSLSAVHAETYRNITIPDMTGPTTPSPYIVIDTLHFTTIPGFGAYKDCLTYTANCVWGSGGGNVANLTLDFGASNTTTRITNYSLYGTASDTTRNPSQWEIYVSNDNTTWTLIDSRTGQTGWSIGQVRKYNVATPTQGRYVLWRVLNSDGDTQVGIGYIRYQRDIDFTPIPSFSTVRNNATFLTKQGNVINWTSTVSSSGTLNTCWFTVNDTGTFTNNSFPSCSGSSSVLNVSLTITASNGKYVCAFFGANTSGGQELTSSQSCFNVQDGYYQLNISILDRRNNQLIQSFNASLNGTGQANQGKTTSNGFLFFRTNLSTVTIKVNTSFGISTVNPYVISGSQNLTFGVPRFTLSYPTSALETSTVTFQISINNTEQDENNYENFGLIFNNSLLTPSATTTNTNLTYISTFILPSITTIGAANNWYWNYSFINNNYNTENFTFTNQQILIFSTGCNPNDNNVTVNLTIYNEDQPTNKLNATLEAQFILFISNRTTTINQTFTKTSNTSFYFCLQPSAEITQTDAEFKYVTSNGFTHRYFLINKTLSNQTTVIEAYNFNTTSGISNLKITVRNEETFGQLQNIIVQLSRKYVGTGKQPIVQMSKTGDFGLAFFNVKEESEDYQLFFLDGLTGRNLKTSDVLSFACTNGLCEFTFLITPEGTETVIPDVGVTYSYDPTTKILSYAFNDAANEVSSIQAEVTKETLVNTESICSSSVSATSGSGTCNLTGYDGPFQLSISSDNGDGGFQYIIEFGDSVNSIVTALGGQEVASFFAFLIVVLLGVAGSTLSIMAGGLLTLTGVVIVFLLGLVSFMGAGVIITIAVVTVLIGNKVLRK